MEDTGQWAWVLDDGWRLVYVTTAVRITYGGISGHLARFRGSTLYVGAVTTAGRSEVTALGDEVNEAARIEACATGGRTLASRALLERLDAADAARVQLDPDRIVYTALANLATATENARRDAPAISVGEVGSRGRRPPARAVVSATIEPTGFDPARSMRYGAHMSALLVTPAELSERLGRQGGPRVLDARPASRFAAGHLTGAFHLDPFGISLIDSRPAPLKAWEWIMQHLFELRGVTRDEPVVVYEETSGMRAARLVWLLRLFGHPDVRLLDGGIGRWRAERRPIARDAVAEPEAATVLAIERRTEHLATVEDVLAALGDRGVAIVDARSRAEYAGTLVRAARGGAIPGAVHLEYTANLTSDGRYRSVSEIRSMYEALGVTPDREVITYCQGAYRAAQSWIALREAGYPRVRCYVGSWNEWGNRTDLPVELPR